jgi:hypothetical protein
MNDLTDAEIYTCQHTTLTEGQPCFLRDSNPQLKQASGHKPKPRTSQLPGLADVEKLFHICEAQEIFVLSEVSMRTALCPPATIDK